MLTLPALEYVWNMCVCMCMLMGAHRSRLSEISNAIVIDKLNGKQRMVTFAGDSVIEDDENWEDNTLILLLFFSWRITPYYNFLESMETQTDQNIFLSKSLLQFVSQRYAVIFTQKSFYMQVKVLFLKPEQRIIICNNVLTNFSLSQSYLKSIANLRVTNFWDWYDIIWTWQQLCWAYIFCVLLNFNFKLTWVIHGIIWYNCCFCYGIIRDKKNNPQNYFPMLR